MSLQLRVCDACGLHAYFNPRYAVFSCPSCGKTMRVDHVHKKKEETRE